MLQLILLARYLGIDGKHIYKYTCFAIYVYSVDAGMIFLFYFLLNICILFCNQN